VQGNERRPLNSDCFTLSVALPSALVGANEELDRKIDLILSKLETPLLEELIDLGQSTGVVLLKELSVRPIGNLYKLGLVIDARGHAAEFVITNSAGKPANVVISRVMGELIVRRKRSNGPPGKVLFRINLKDYKKNVGGKIELVTSEELNGVSPIKYIIEVASAIDRPKVKKWYKKSEMSFDDKIDLTNDAKSDDDMNVVDIVKTAVLGLFDSSIGTLVWNVGWDKAGQERKVEGDLKEAVAAKGAGLTQYLSTENPDDMKDIFNELKQNIPKFSPLLRSKKLIRLGSLRVAEKIVGNIIKELFPKAKELKLAKNISEREEIKQHHQYIQKNITLAKDRILKELRKCMHVDESPTKRGINNCLKKFERSAPYRVGVEVLEFSLKDKLKKSLSLAAQKKVLQKARSEFNRCTAERYFHAYQKKNDDFNGVKKIQGCLIAAIIESVEKATDLVLNEKYRDLLPGPVLQELIPSKNISVSGMQKNSERLSEYRQLQKKYQADIKRLVKKSHNIIGEFFANKEGAPDDLFYQNTAFRVYNYDILENMQIDTFKEKLTKATTTTTLRVGESLIRKILRRTLLENEELKNVLLKRPEYLNMIIDQSIKFGLRPCLQAQIIEKTEINPELCREEISMLALQKTAEYLIPEITELKLRTAVFNNKTLSEFQKVSKQNLLPKKLVEKMRTKSTLCFQTEFKTLDKFKKIMENLKGIQHRCTLKLYTTIVPALAQSVLLGKIKPYVDGIPAVRVDALTNKLKRDLKVGIDDQLIDGKIPGKVAALRADYKKKKLAVSAEKLKEEALNELILEEIERYKIAGTVGVAELVLEKKIRDNFAEGKQGPEKQAQLEKVLALIPILTDADFKLAVGAAYASPTDEQSELALSKILARKTLEWTKLLVVEITPYKLKEFIADQRLHEKISRSTSDFIKTCLESTMPQLNKKYAKNNPQKITHLDALIELCMNAGSVFAFKNIVSSTLDKKLAEYLPVTSKNTDSHKIINLYHQYLKNKLWKDGMLPTVESLKWDKKLNGKLKTLGDKIRVSGTNLLLSTILKNIVYKNMDLPKPLLLAIQEDKEFLKKTQQQNTGAGKISEKALSIREKKAKNDSNQIIGEVLPQALNCIGNIPLTKTKTSPAPPVALDQCLNELTLETTGKIMQIKFQNNLGLLANSQVGNGILQNAKDSFGECTKNLANGSAGGSYSEEIAQCSLSNIYKFSDNVAFSTLAELEVLRDDKKNTEQQVRNCFASIKSDLQRNSKSKKLTSGLLQEKIKFCVDQVLKPELKREIKSHLLSELTTAYDLDWSQRGTLNQIIEEVLSLVGVPIETSPKVEKPATKNLANALFEVKNMVLSFAGEAISYDPTGMANSIQDLKTRIHKMKAKKPLTLLDLKRHLLDSKLMEQIIYSTLAKNISPVAAKMLKANGLNPKELPRLTSVAELKRIMHSEQGQKAMGVIKDKYIYFLLGGKDKNANNSIPIKDNNGKTLIPKVVVDEVTLALITDTADGGFVDSAIGTKIQNEMTAKFMGLGPIESRVARNWYTLKAQVDSYAFGTITTQNDNDDFSWEDYQIKDKTIRGRKNTLTGYTIRAYISQCLMVPMVTGPPLILAEKKRRQKVIADLIKLTGKENDRPGIPSKKTLNFVKNIKYDCYDSNASDIIEERAKRLQTSSP